MVSYLDNSATTQVRQEVIESMLPFFGEQWGNASSLHAVGRAAKKALDNARDQVAQLLNCNPEEILFSAGGTNSNNVALLGRARFLEANNCPRHLITCQIEHPSVLGPAKYLESCGWRVTYLPVDCQGFVDPEKLRSAITPETSMVSIIWASNEIGSVQPIQELANIAWEREIYFHTDAVQVAGKLPIDLAKVPVSALSLSGHKFYAPKGVGVLFIRSGTNIMPIAFGGGQEKGLFAGTEAIANIVGVGKAAQLAKAELSATQDKLIAMQQILMEKLLQSAHVKITGAIDLKRRLPGHVSFVINGAAASGSKQQKDSEQPAARSLSSEQRIATEQSAESGCSAERAKYERAERLKSTVFKDSLVLRCDLQGMCVSSGSACHKGTIEPSNVLKAIGLSDDESRGSLRISFGKYNSIEESKITAEKLAFIMSDQGVAVR